MTFICLSNCVIFIYLFFNLCPLFTFFLCDRGTKGENWCLFLITTKKKIILFLNKCDDRWKNFWLYSHSFVVGVCFFFFVGRACLNKNCWSFCWFLSPSKSIFIIFAYIWFLQRIRRSRYSTNLFNVSKTDWWIYFVSGVLSVYVRIDIHPLWHTENRTATALYVFFSLSNLCDVSKMPEKREIRHSDMWNERKYIAPTRFTMWTSQLPTNYWNHSVCAQTFRGTYDTHGNVESMAHLLFEPVFVICRFRFVSYFPLYKRWTLHQQTHWRSLFATSMYCFYI